MYWMGNPPKLHCECCDRELNPKTAVWLELNMMTGEWSKEAGVIKEEESQGWFSFGPDCAKKKLKGD